MNDHDQIDQWIRDRANPPRPEPDPELEPQPKPVDVRGLTSGAASPDDVPPNMDSWIRRQFRDRGW